MRKKNGFTLIELLATIVILAIIMTVAVPSTISILDNNKKESMASDAKRLVALAESEIRNNDRVDTNFGGVIVFYFNDLDDGSFEKDPDNTAYVPTESFVIVHKKGTSTDYKFDYYVQLYGGKRGIPLTLSTRVERDSVISKTTPKTVSAALTEVGITPTATTYYKDL